MSATYRMVPGGVAPRRLNVNGIKATAPTSPGDTVVDARSPSSVLPAGDESATCFTLSASSISGASTLSTSTRTLPCRATVPPPPPPKPLWPTASRQRTVKEDRRRENEQLAAAAAGHRRHHVQSERSTSLEDGGVMSSSQPVPVTTWDQSAASMPMLPEETTTDDVTESRATVASSTGTGCSGGGKLAMFFLVGIPVIGIVAAALAWFYTCRQVSSSM